MIFLLMIIDGNSCPLPSCSAAPPVGGGALKDSSQLCPYAAMGHCYFEDKCPYLHGSRCQVCGLQVLHPHDPEQRRAHEKVRGCYFCYCSTWSRESRPTQT